MLQGLKRTSELLTALDKAQNPKTNADRIRAMSDEDLADFINNSNTIICDSRTSEECKISYCGVCGQCVLDWLQQPAEEE